MLCDGWLQLLDLDQRRAQRVWWAPSRVTVLLSESL
jgi:hypothetical protein